VNLDSTVLAIALAAFFVGLGTGKVLAVPSMPQRAADVGYSVDAYRRIGSLELAGAVGLLVGIAVVPVGTAAGAGLLLLLAGALVTHLRHRDEPATVAPAAAAAVLVLAYLAFHLAAA